MRIITAGGGRGRGEKKKTKKTVERASALGRTFDFLPKKWSICVGVNLGGIWMVVSVACLGPRTTETVQKTFSANSFYCVVCHTQSCQKVGLWPSRI